MSKNKRWSFVLLGSILSFLVMSDHLLGNGNTFDDKSASKLENSIAAALKKMVPARDLSVRIELAQSGGQKIQKLIVKMEGVEIGQLVADRMTVLLENPVIDQARLEKERLLVFRSQGRCQVGIFATASRLESYLQKKAEQFNKKNVNISLKFSPPYIECTYDVPKSEIASESLDLLKKFIPGDKIEGYAAFKLDAKENGLYASSSKVIANHFLLPGALLKIFENKFNPFDQIVVLQPFEYTINKLTVQAKYAYLSN